MREFAAPVERLAEHFQRLPGIERKSAQRLAFHVVSMPPEQARDFADAILAASASVKRCGWCRTGRTAKTFTRSIPVSILHADELTYFPPLQDLRAEGSSHGEIFP